MPSLIWWTLLLAETISYAARGAGIGYIVIIDPEDSGLIWVGEQVDCVIQEHEQLYEMLCQRIQEKKTNLS